MVDHDVELAQRERVLFDHGHAVATPGLASP
jgi:hypothetical protein